MATGDTNERARQIGRVADALLYLGNGNASTQMGAIEAASMLQKEGLSAIADGIDTGCSAIAESLDGVADAIRAFTKAVEKLADA